MADHPTQPYFYKGEFVDIDVEIVPLILKLWSLGIDTSFSCQGNPAPEDGFMKPAYISFPSQEAFLKFADRMGGLQGILDTIEYVFIRHPFSDAANENRVAIYFRNQDIGKILDIISRS